MMRQDQTAPGADPDPLHRWTQIKSKLEAAKHFLVTVGCVVRRDKAAGLITVSRALKDELSNLGIDPARVQVLRNGVDLQMFRPTDREAARSRLEVQSPTLLSVGHLIRPKRHDLVIRALTGLSDATLLIVGGGPEERALKRLVQQLGIVRRVRFLGSVPHEQLCEIYNSADALVLASDREGWPNVLLEAMACGTPVVASNVGGIPEIVTSPAAGVLLPDRTPDAIATSVRALLKNPPSRLDTRAHAEHFGWREVADRQVDLYRRIIDCQAAR